MHVDEAERAFEVTLAVPQGRPRTVRVAATSGGRAPVLARGPRPGATAAGRLAAALAHVLRLDEDLSDFYALAREDPELAWAVAGAGRMVRSPTVFEEVVKTICTTNCSWGATRKMVGTLVAELGAPAFGAPATGPSGRAFPTPEAMAGVEPDFYRETVRAGYRGPYLAKLAEDVASGEVDLEALGHPGELTDEEVHARLVALPGVGPYAAAHIMLMLGRYSRLILDSWTRPKYARLIKRRAVTDAAIHRRFRRYGRYAGLAFWLFLTRDWVED
ncbi:MAG: DNA-3-methyladenine glycosylase [Actinomycetota bacterium]